YPNNATWDDNGARGINDRYTTNDAETRVYGNTYGWATWSGTGITNTVKAWQANPSSNYGWVVDINYSNDDTNRAIFHSSEYGSSSPDYAWRPKLDITYTLAPVADADGPYLVTPTELDLLDGTSSYDPDGENIVSWLWDLDNDNEYDDASGSTCEVTYNYLVHTLGLTPGQMHDIGLKVIDDEGEYAYTASSINLVPEPSTLVLLVVMGLLLGACRGFPQR
ncbi:MAG: PEP-CTERM sorting domain-containing protein, partial [Pirellulales bacterium]|nr:PEP-CTERM sorting domain-containing protein [Pirellulales bacterium]